MGNYNADANPDLNKIRNLAFNYKLVKQADLKIDQFSTAGANKVYHYAKKIGSTRLQFLVDPTQVSG